MMNLIQGLTDWVDVLVVRVVLVGVLAAGIEFQISTEVCTWRGSVGFLKLLIFKVLILFMDFNGRPTKFCV